MMGCNLTMGSLELCKNEVTLVRAEMADHPYVFVLICIRLFSLDTIP